MSRINELRLMARLAQMYHGEGRVQADIARHMRISQATVSRMLRRAEVEGIVRTIVSPPPGTYRDLEDGLRRAFDVSEAIVADCAEDRDGAVMARIGEAAAHFLEVTLQDGEVIGVSSWSRTILRMVENLHPLKADRARTVVQTLGGMGSAGVQAHATHLTTRLAQLTGAEPRLLPAPGVAQSREARLVMLGDPTVREATDLWGDVTLAIQGIGAVRPSDLLAGSGNVFSAPELDELARRGAVGNMGLRFFDRDGGPVRTPLDDRVIGMTLDEMRAVGRVVALAGGQGKTEAIAGALRTGAVDVLVTDRFTAERLVQAQGGER